MAYVREMSKDVDAYAPSGVWPSFTFLFNGHFPASGSTKVSEAPLEWLKQYSSQVRSDAQPDAHVQSSAWNTVRQT